MLFNKEKKSAKYSEKEDDNQEYINAQYYMKYKKLASAYFKEKEFDKFEYYMKLATSYNACGNEELCRYYIETRNFEKAKKCLENLIKREKKFAKQENIPYIKRYNYIIKPLENYYNFSIKYPYRRKELLNMYKIDVKTFNNLTKKIKSDNEYKCNSAYSEKIIKYLDSKLKS